MTAYRSVSSADGKFTQVSNDLIRNEDLSVLARFIVCYVLSLHPDHHFTAEWLEGKLPGYGTRSVRAALNELKAHGYMKVTRTSRGRGRWEWEQVISDGPLDVVSSERERTDETTCENTSPQVVSSVRLSSDDGGPDKELNTETPKDEDQNKASRHARAERASTQMDTPAIIRSVRLAIERAHTRRDAEEISDDDALALYAKLVRGRHVDSLVAYLAGIFQSAHIDGFLSNTEDACTGCLMPESDCRCPAAA